jgi:hypothetical protein
MMTVIMPSPFAEETTSSCSNETHPKTYAQAPPAPEERRSFWSKLFQSNDSTFSNDSTTELLRQQMFQSQDSFTNKLMLKTESENSTAINPTKLPTPLSLERRTSPDHLQSASHSLSTKLPDVFASGTWAPHYAPKHVDIDVNNVFKSHFSQDTTPSTTDISTTTLTAIAGKTDWDALYRSELSGAMSSKKPAPAPSPVASSIHAPPVVATQPRAVIVPATFTVSTTSKKRRPDVGHGAEFVPTTPTERDVLLGRGGRTNNHAGNKRYLEAKERIQERYMAASKQGKTVISQDLVNVVHAWGGRFLKMDTTTEQWYEADEIVARKKASQSLREINTPEERLAKRQRYGR